MHYMRIKCNKNRINMQKIIKKFKKPPQNALHYQKNMYNYFTKTKEALYEKDKYCSCWRRLW